MKKEIVDRICLSGKVGDTRYRIGVANPYSGRKTVSLGPAHLAALRAMLALVDLEQLDQPFVVPEAVFAKHFPMDGGVDLLKNVLLGWMETDTKECNVVSTIADVTFYQNRDSRRMIVRLNECIVELVRKLHCSAANQRPARRDKQGNKAA